MCTKFPAKNSTKYFVVDFAEINDHNSKKEKQSQSGKESLHKKRNDIS